MSLDEESDFPDFVSDTELKDTQDRVEVNLPLKSFSGVFSYPHIKTGDL